MQRTQTTCLAILTTIAVGFSLYFLRTVLLPFVIALFLVIGCRPILEFIENKLRLHRFFAFAITFVIGVGLVIGFGALTWISINNLARNSAIYEERLDYIVTWTINHTPKLGTSKSEPEGHEHSETSTLQTDEGGLQEDISKGVKDMLASATEYLQGMLLRLAGALSGLLSYGVLILIFVFFLLLGQESTAQEQPVLLEKVESQVRQYLVVKTIISAVTGAAFGVVLWLFGVPLAFVFGFLAFLLNFIPNIGPLISTIIPVPFLMLNPLMSPTSAIICFVLIALIHFVSGNVIETRIMGKSFDVSPVVLLLALMFFGLVWGIIGMFLATPIVSILKIILQQHEATRPLAELFAGRWVRPEASPET